MDHLRPYGRAVLAAICARISQARFGAGVGVARQSEVHIDVTLPNGVPEDRRDALLAVAAHCTAHNSRTTPHEVTVAHPGTPVTAG